MKSTIIRSRQQYRGITDILKYLAFTNQIYMDINRINSVLQEVKQSNTEFFKAYILKDAEIPNIRFTNESTMLSFNPVNSDVIPSMCSKINEMEDILKYCKDRIASL